MAKVRYHLGPQGPGVCRVDKGNARSKGCPFGGESGSENHFATMAEAEVAYAEQMEASGNGLVAVAARVKPGIKISPFVSNLAADLKTAARNRFDALAADSYYGIRSDAKGNFLASSSEGLERFSENITKSSGYEIEPEIDYADSDAGIISSIYIKELDLSVENENLEDDLQSLHDDREMVAANGREYWR